MIRITPCAAPSATCQDGQWFRYEVRTATALNSATGYAPGPRSNAQRRATAALDSLRRMEGNPRPGSHDICVCSCYVCARKKRWLHPDKKPRSGR